MYCCYIFFTLCLLVVPIITYNEHEKEYDENYDDNWDCEEFEAPDTLELVHVILRHGDRTVDTTTFYPKDPYKDEQFPPYGPGELTNAGKTREFELGQALRRRYNSFLGKRYTNYILEAVSSSLNRTIMSLQLVLAGCFPPSGDLLWDIDLPWQPIPFSIVPMEQNSMFLPLSVCPNFDKHLNYLINSPKKQREFKRHKAFFDYLEKNTGSNISSYWDLFSILSCLTCEREWGLTLPEWTKNVYPEPLRSLAQKGIDLVTETTHLKRVTAGFMLKKIVDVTREKATGNLNPERKIYFYSGHEFNIIFMLKALHVWFPHLPPYGAYIMMEVHKINGIYGIKVYYQDYTSCQPQLLKLPACSEFCPFDRFEQLTSEYFADDTTCGLETCS